MSNIKILSPNLINQISAGEVVEGPVSIIKELIENSLDAKSNSISIDIRKAGKEIISVLDNGEGMTKEDLKLAFQRYATSKIYSLEDINKINTFGFRGEALAAISAVSKLEVFSSNQNNGLGYSIKVKNSTLDYEGPCSFPRGTRVIVEDLFFNTPARMKFLKSDATESNKIFNVLDRMAFCNPKVRFQINSQKRQQVFPATEDYLVRLKQIVSKDIADFLIPISTKSSGVQVQGYIGHPSIAKDKRYHQWIYVNGRPIFSFAMNRAVYRGFNTLLMRNQHPVFYIALNVEPDFVDVNVHPTKNEIRFTNDALVSTIVAEAVRGALTSSTRNLFLNSNSSFSLKEDIHPDKHIKSLANISSSLKTAEKNKTLDASQSETLPKQNNQPFCESLNSNAKSVDNTTAKAIFDQNPEPNLVYNKIQFSDIEAQLDKNRFLVLAQFDKYILTERENNLVLFDMHATHERILYEKIKSDFTNETVKTATLLEPELLKLASYEIFILENNKELWQKLGFEFRNLGSNDFYLISVPHFLSKNILKRTTFVDIMHNIFAELTEFDSLNAIDQYYHQACATIACHSAIRGRERLNKEEMQNLIDQISKLEIDLYCPHGRPIYQTIRSHDIDKIFKRVL